MKHIKKGKGKPFNSKIVKNLGKKIFFKLFKHYKE